MNFDPFLLACAVLSTRSPTFRRKEKNEKGEGAEVARKKRERGGREAVWYGGFPAQLSCFPVQSSCLPAQHRVSLLDIVFAVQPIVCLSVCLLVCLFDRLLVCLFVCLCVWVR